MTTHSLAAPNPQPVGVRSLVLAERWQLVAALLGSLVIAALAFAAVAPSLDGGLLWDDRPLLLQNPDVVSADGLLRIWKGERSPDYFPLTMTVAWLEHRLWGEDPFGWRLTNLLFHIASCLLVWCVLRELQVSGAWLAAAIFAVHPVTVASVAWISELKNVCSLLFATLACWAYLTFDRLGGRWRYALAVVSFLFALLSKTSVVMLPPVLVLFVWWRRSQAATRLTRQDLLRLAPLFLCSLVLGLVTVWFQSNRVVGDVVVRPEGAASRLASTGWIVWFYVITDLLPVQLSMIYPRWHIDPARLTAWIPLVLAVAAVTSAWTFRQRGTRGLLVASGFFLLMLLPVCGWFDTYFSIFSLVSDHWQYVPLLGTIAGMVAGAAAGATWLFARWPGAHAHLWQRVLGAVPAALVLLALVNLSRHRAAEFRSEEALWTATIRHNPQAWVAFNNLAPILNAQGEQKAAEWHYRQALSLRPDYAVAHNNLGVLLSRQQKYTEATEHFRQAVASLPNYYEAWSNWGNALARQAKFAEAAKRYRQAIEIEPDYATGHYNLGQSLAKRRNYAEAIPHYERAVEIEPDYAKAWNSLGLAHSALRQFVQAIPCFEHVIQLDPRRTDARRSLEHARHALVSASRYDRYR